MHHQGRQVSGAIACAADGGLDPLGRTRIGREMEGASLAHFAVDPDPSLHQFDQLRGDGKSQAGAAETPRGRGIGLAERFEDPLSRLSRGDADARIAHRRSACVHLLSEQSARASTSTKTSPCSVNLRALPTRLTMICRSRPASPRTCSRHVGAMRQTSSTPLCAAETASTRVASMTTSCSSTGA